jgi:hypothetical protein
VKFSGDKRTVIDGPFAETKELVAGFTIIQVKSLEEAIEWVKRAPNLSSNGEAEVEIRKVLDHSLACRSSKSMFGSAKISANRIAARRSGIFLRKTPTRLPTVSIIVGPTTDRQNYLTPQ